MVWGENNIISSGVIVILLLCAASSYTEYNCVCVCVCWQVGVVTAMTLAEFIMRVSLLLSVGKQACGWRDRNATNEQEVCSLAL